MLVADEFKDEGVERELEAPEEGVPCGGVAGAGLLDGQMFMVGHGMCLQSGECGGGGKVQMEWERFSVSAEFLGRIAREFGRNGGRSTRWGYSIQPVGRSGREDGLEIFGAVWQLA